MFSSSDNQHPKIITHSQTVGPQGPVTAYDAVLHETLEGFVNEKLIPRAVHTKGWGAFGQFILTHSMSEYTRACFLQTPGTPVSTFSRFSLAVSTHGTPDTSRNVRGFTTRFFTEEGPFDLLTNHIPVFLIRDSIKFPAAIHALSPSPVNNLLNPESFWSFVTENPEALLFATMLYSDLGTVDNLRMIRTYGVNTYTWINAKGERHFVKYHLIPAAGERVIDSGTARKLAGENPDIAGEDLYHTLAFGGKVEYGLFVQIMKPCDMMSQPYDPLDDTKMWDEEQFPLHPVGRLYLTANVRNYKNEVEKSAFSPANLLDGIELSNDKMLQGRSFIYWDAQRRRLGPDFRQISINRLPDWRPSSLISTNEGEKADGRLCRSDIMKADDYTQAGEWYRSLDESWKENLASNIASELSSLPDLIQYKVLGLMEKADPDYAESVRKQIRLCAQKR